MKLLLQATFAVTCMLYMASIHKKRGATAVARSTC